jgi:hypothetical protein
MIYGKYEFLAIPPDQEYYLEFNFDGHCRVILSGRKWIKGGDDEKDSDVGMNGRTHNFSIAPGEFNYSFDAGLIVLGSIGSFVWEDMNGNGIQDPGEKGIEGYQGYIVQCRPQIYP